MMLITPRGIGRLSVEVVIGDRNLGAGIEVRDDELTTNVLEVVVVNPDIGSTLEVDGITTPDELGIDIRDTDVLDDNVVAFGKF